jgi:amidase
MLCAFRSSPRPPSTKCQRLAVVAEPPGGGTDPVVAACVRRAAGALADAGHAVTEACPERHEEAALLWAAIVQADFEGTIEFLVT